MIPIEAREFATRLWVTGAFPTALAQPPGNEPATRALPGWAALEEAEAARGQHFVDAVNALSVGASGEKANASGSTAYVMIDLPATPASDKRPIVLEFRGVRADTLATFYNEACKGQRNAVDFQCPAARFTTTITQKLPAVAQFTRVCPYDRPGTYLLPDRLSRSDPTAIPRSARDIVLDLRALLRAARVPSPYVLVGHSFGGMVARLYATTYPRRESAATSIRVAGSNSRIRRPTACRIAARCIHAWRATPRGDAAAFDPSWQPRGGSTT